jgi:hypothetical protein
MGILIIAGERFFAPTDGLCSSYVDNKNIGIQTSQKVCKTSYLEKLNIRRGEKSFARDACMFK